MKNKINIDECEIIYNENTDVTGYDLLTDLFIEYVNNLYKRPVLERIIKDEWISPTKPGRNKGIQWIK